MASASASAMDLTPLEQDPRLFLYTSLTAGSSHIITATSRLETILKANRIPFQAIDTATDERARRLWQRRAGKRKLPGLVKEGFVVGDLEEVEEWNEFGELKENIGPVPANDALPPSGRQRGVNLAPPLPVSTTATKGTAEIGSRPPGLGGGDHKAVPPLVDHSKIRPLSGTTSGAGGESILDEPVKAETMTSAPAEKERSVDVATGEKGQRSGIDHLSAPASALQSGTATPGAGSGVEGGEEGDVAGSEGKEVPVLKGGRGEGEGEGVRTQVQAAKEGDDATKSVED